MKTAKQRNELRELRAEIATARGTLGSPHAYGAQLICYALKAIAKKFGKAEANKAIRELYLETHGWSERP